ncbi:MAG: NnrU family protein [Pseudomonadota bacterium]
MDVLIAMIVFVVSHVVVSRSRIKPMAIEAFGERAFRTGYSLMSLLLLGWVVITMINADRIIFWATPGWSYPFAAIMTLIAFVLIGLGSFVPNPLSASFRKKGYDAAKPGIIGWIRHPLIWGLTLWGFAHIPANGDWPSLILFAGTAVFGVVGARGLSKRYETRLGADTWRELTPARGHIDGNAVIGTLFGLALWAIVLVGHGHLFGADPLSVLQAQFDLN